jgi:uncharacterized protein (TIGR02147 family)
LTEQASTAELPDIFAYQDHLQYLRDYYAARKTRNRNFSHRYVIGKVGASSPGWFADVLKGRTRMTGAHLAKMVPLLDLRPGEEAYFEALVHFGQAGIPEEKERYRRRLKDLREVKAEIVGQDQFDFYSYWYLPVIREILLGTDFRGDFKALGRKLRPSIPASRAKRAVLLLEGLGLVRQDAKGRYLPVTRNLRKDSSRRSGHVSAYLKANMRLATRALDELDKEQRDISCLTLTLSGENLLRAREELRSLRRKLLALGEASGDGDGVYQCNLQLFPVTGKTD